MRASSLLCLLLFSALAPGQSNSPTEFSGTTLTADRLRHDGPLLRGSGHVRVRIAGLVLEADNGVQDLEKQLIDLHGHAVVRLPTEPPFWVVRWGPGRVIVATDPTTISADEVSITPRILHVRGHIQMKKDFTLLQGDEADFYLYAGDAEVKGNLRVDGASPAPPAFRTRRLNENFPPDIVRQ